ncbi:DUF1963 domain-containing protein [Flammeovirgaceae bacterium SG7u.111]|nr:DUF1963 domain-containing protein [Flammeovirgaceae bacterium SG7u.132]WPO33168.1 DUF1963 domain-containing protein [Flammeovirgaceae bacterium SG7u.111]
MKEDVIKGIKSTELPDNIKHEVINSLTCRYLIEPRKENIQIGDSKIGGFPHLPRDYEYPQEVDYYYEFVGQLKLSDLYDNEISYLPNTGMLYFFIDDDFNVGNVNAKVIYLDIEPRNLQIKKPPENKKSRCEAFMDRTETTELKLSISKAYTIKQELIDNVIDNYIIKEKTSMADFDIEEFFTMDQVWGFTTTWGISEAPWSAYLTKRRFQSLYYLTTDYKIKYLKEKNIDLTQWVKNELEGVIAKRKESLAKYDKTLAIYPYWEQDLVDMEYTKLYIDEFMSNLEYHKSESKKWSMLLSLSSYYDAEIKFGDGKMEFFANSDDLENGNYDDIYCHIYN